MAGMRESAFFVTLFLIVNAAAAMVASLIPEGAQAFEDPGDPANTLIYLALFAVATALVLLLIVMRRGFFLRAVMAAAMLVAVTATLFIPLYAFTGAFIPALAASGGGALALVGGSFLSRSVAVRNLAALVLCAGAAALIGASLSPLPAAMLLVLLAAYDYWAVRGSGHMMRLAEGVGASRLPLMLVLPSDDEAYTDTIMGLGDIAVPGLLTVSAYYHLSGAAGHFAWSHAAVAAAVAAGGALGALMLMRSLGDEPAPGLPWINGGALLGLLASYPLLFPLL